MSDWKCASTCLPTLASGEWWAATLMTMSLSWVGTVALAQGTPTPAQSATLTSTAPAASASGPSVGASPATLILPAQVAAYQSALLTAKVAGYLKSVAVDKGDRVKAGALIAELEVPELLADETQYKAQAAVARSEYERIERAAKSSPDLVTPDNVDAARGRLDVAQAQLDRIETLLRYARIVAPFSGTITARYADPGAFIPVASTGGQQSAAIVSLMDFSRVRVQIPIPEGDAARIRPGTPAVISANGLPGEKFTAVVTRISYALDPGAHTMLAEIEMHNPGELLRPGMYVSVQLTPGLEVQKP